MSIMAEDANAPEQLPLELSHPHLKEFSQLLGEMHKESDRGQALISCSFIDELLRRTLLAFFKKGTDSTKLVEGFGAPLGSLSTRSAAAYSLGLITEEEFAECKILRKIRNMFAHEIHISFKTEGVQKLCLKLKYRVKDYDSVVVNSQGQFMTSATALILNLTNRPFYVAKERRQSTVWPY